VGTVGTGGRVVTDVAVGLDTVSLLADLSEVATGATAAAGATMGPPLAASAAAVLCWVTAAPCRSCILLVACQKHDSLHLSVYRHVMPLLMVVYIVLHAKQQYACGLAIWQMAICTRSCTSWACG